MTRTAPFFVALAVIAAPASAAEDEGAGHHEWDYGRDHGPAHWGELKPVETGQENALVRELWNDLPREKGHEEVRDDVQVDASGLLPAARGYYTFDGSLTTPPCTESVTWFVLKRPVPVSAAEVAQFARLYPNDARPAQPLHGRVVRESN